MKQFPRHKTLDEIKAQCEAQGLELDTRPFDQGGDSIIVCGGGAHVFYNVINGNFYGRTPSGVEFNNRAAELDDVWWYDAMLNFFYAPIQKRFTVRLSRMARGSQQATVTLFATSPKEAETLATDIPQHDGFLVWTDSDEFAVGETGTYVADPDIDIREAPK